MATNIPASIPRSTPLAPAEPAFVPKSGKVAQVKTMCTSCTLRELCLPCWGLTQSEMDVADSLVFDRSRVRRGESLYRTGESFTSLYAVRNGFFKATVLLADGRRDQVTGFAMPGEIIGMDGIGPGKHTCNTIALEDSDVCAIPFVKLQEMAHEFPSLQQQLRKTMSREIVREQGVMQLLGSMYAEERLAIFLLNLSKRFAARGYSPSEFNLRMTRDEIGSYLGMTLETVSRIFSQFQDEGLIAVQRKLIRIRDSSGLERVVGREIG